ncbi:MAG: ferrous iron transport protein B [Candidatus Hydrogenedentes bacterium]|nr:ferrous iron transport protein B [Candidatus Hydrogenedentota bacterium]
MIRIAIAGNPNAGKTSIFNFLTGAAQQVSNYPGVTVERKEGIAHYGEHRLTVVDLPGTYSLTAYSREEVVARQFIVEEKPELVVDVVDASNLERNLYLTVQLMEMQVPLAIALNMADIAEKRGFVINVERLSLLLGVPVIATVGNRGRGIFKLLKTCVDALENPEQLIPKPVTYGHEVDQAIDELSVLIARFPAIADRYPPRWVAVKLIETDEEVAAEVRTLCGADYDTLAPAVERAARAIATHFDDDAGTIIAERRYGFAAGAYKECVTFKGEARRHITDKIDAVVCNRYLGPLIMLGVVTALFFWVFKISDEWAWIPWFGGPLSPTGLMVWFFEQLARLSSGLETRMPMLHSLVDDGIIQGVGGVMSFVPLIFVMFLFISALEDTGYIARVAFILDRVMQTFGLQGKSILAMIVSGGLGAGGCAVPGVMATRTLREERDRLVTMMVAPLMNCGAKMPVYAMLIAAFFPERRTGMMLLLWGISWLVALSAAWVLRRFVIRGEQTPFVMELPPYHVPVARSVLKHTWERTWMYVRKAGTIILAINIVLWALMYFPRPPEEAAARPEAGHEQAPAEERAAELAYSFAGRFGQALEPLTGLAGFDWRTNIALVGGFAAKEVVIGTLGTAYSMGDVDPENAQPLAERLRYAPDWTPLKAFALMIFVMIYAPCLATVAVITRESGSWKWALFATAYSTAIAFVLALLIYQIGGWLGLGA